MNSKLGIFVLLLMLLTAGQAVFPGAVPQAHAEDDWRAEFDDICGKTTDAMMLSPAELRSLIDRCEKLKPRIEKLEETAAKVYLKRLRLCRDLFVFVLENPGK